MNPISRFITSPANWSGIGMATLALAPQALGVALWGGWLLAPLGYGVGFAVAGLWFGYPKFSAQPWDDLEFTDDGDAREAMNHALDSVRGLVKFNPDDRLSASLQADVLDLCSQLRTLFDQWDRSKGKLSLEESFQARHIVLSYLPDALKTYLSIPPRYARSRVLSNGHTAEDTFRETVKDLSMKVLQLTEDLASQDADAFLSHSRFLHEKFGASKNPLKQIEQ
ncbi:MAG: hypothetical protein H7255_17235 [Ramlibacter sp.]|nr:hypothetical protein [Ramlibacter sp.]